MVSITDVTLDLLQILEEASESGRLVGGDETTLAAVEQMDRDDKLMLVLSDGTAVKLQITPLSERPV